MIPAKPGSSHAPSVNPKLNPLSLIRMIWRQRLTIALSWAAISLAGILFIMRMPTRYQAEAMILVESQKIPENLVSSTVNAEIQDRLATIRQQILSSTRLQKIIDKFNLYPKTTLTREEMIERMRKDIKITLERGWTRNQPGAFRISYTGANPETVASVANEISSLFIEENLRTREVQAVGTSEFLESQLKQAKKNLEEQEAKVSQYKLAHTGELPEQEQALLAMLDRLQAQLQGNHEGINHAEQTKTMLEREIESAEAYRNALGGISVDSATGNIVVSAGSSPAVSVMTAKRSDALRRELEELLVRYTINHPVVRETQLALANALKQEEELQRRQMAVPVQPEGKPAAQAPAPTARIRPEMAQTLMREQERINTLKTQLSITDKDLESKRQQQKNIEKMIAEAQARVEKLPIRQQEMAGLLRDYDISRDNYKSLLNKDFSAEMSSDMEKRQKSERFTPLDPARVPEKPHSPNRPLLNSISIEAGLVLALMIAFAREWKKDVLLGEWELPAGTVLLGCIPPISPALPKLEETPPPKPLRKLRWGLVSSLVLSLTILLMIGLWLRRG